MGVLKPSYTDENNGEFYFLHTLTGEYTSRHFDILMAHFGEWDKGWSHWKTENFIEGPDTAEGMALHMGLAFREVMCTLSRVRNAVSYHLPYGLILEGEVARCFDDDSGLYLGADGVYEGDVLAATTEVSLANLAANYDKSFGSRVSKRKWNEVVLKKGAKIVGAFHDPGMSPLWHKQSGDLAPEDEYRQVMKKCRALGLKVLEIEAKWS